MTDPGIAMCFFFALFGVGGDAWVAKGGLCGIFLSWAVCRGWMGDLLEFCHVFSRELIPVRLVFGLSGFGF